MLETITLKKEPQELSFAEEFVLAEALSPLYGLEGEEFSDRLDLLQEQASVQTDQESPVAEIALHAIVQIRIGMAQLLSKIPPEKRTQNTRFKLLKAAFYTVMRNKVSAVLKDLNQTSPASAAYSRAGKIPLSFAKGLKSFPLR